MERISFMAHVQFFCRMLCSSLWHHYTIVANLPKHQNPTSYAMALIKIGQSQTPPEAVADLGFDLRRARNFHAAPGFEPAGLGPKIETLIEVVVLQESRAGSEGFQEWRWRFTIDRFHPRSSHQSRAGSPTAELQISASSGAR